MQQHPGGGSQPPRSFLGNLGDSVTAGVKSYGRWAAALPSRWARAFAFVGPAAIVVLALSAIGNAFGSGGSPAPQVVLLAAVTPAPTLAVTREVVRPTAVVAVANTPLPVPPTAAAPASIPPPAPVPTSAPPVQSAVQNIAPAVPTQPVSAPNLPLVAPATPRPPTPVIVPPTLTPRPPVIAPTIAPATSGGNCSPSYPTVCIPPAPPDLNCKDIPYKKFKVLPPDPHGFDSDHDGIGCES